MKLSRSAGRYGLIAAGLLALYTGIGFLLLPSIAKSQLEQRLSAALGRQVTVEQVRINPYALSLTLGNFSIREPDGVTQFLGWRRLYVNFDALSSLRHEWVLSEVQLEGFAARGVVKRDGSLNVSDLLARFTPPPARETSPPKPSRPLRVGHLLVSEARVEVSDRSRRDSFATTVGPLSFELTNFRTAGERGAPYRFEAVTEAGEKLAWSGTLRAEPFQSTGELRIENVILPKYAPYYADLIQGEIAAGQVSVRGRYRIDLGGAHPVATLTDGAVQLRGFALRERGPGQRALELPAVDVTGIRADAASMKATIAAIAVTGGRARIRREKDGSINLLALLQPGPAAKSTPASRTPAPAPAASSAPAPLPDVTIGEVTVTGFDAGIDDLAAPRPAQLALNGVTLTLKDVSLAEGARIPVQLAFNWAPQGTVRVGGSFSLRPVAAEVTAEVTGMALLPISAYVEQFANVHLTQGAFSAKLAAQVAAPDGKPVSATVAGDIALAKLGLVDSTHDEELAGFGSLALQGLHASTAPDLAVSVDELRLAGPYARVIVGADKSINLLTVAKTAPPPSGPAVAADSASARPAAPAPASAAPPRIEVGKIVISDGDFRFADRSVTPAVNLAVNQFGGTIAGLSSTNPAKGEVDLKAMVDGAGPVAITGKLDPLGAKTAVNLTVEARNVDLLPLSPYTGKYAGYELARGKLVVDVKLAVDGRQIDAANVITLNQFTFGKPVQSPDATKLPVRLAVALLKDLDGRIVIDIPVQGNTDDPEFRIGRVVWRVVGNLLTKAAVSPFSLLGAAFGGGGEELAFQEFAPGASELQPTEVKKLETMVKALTNRPGLSLDLEGSYDQAADAYALKRVKLAAKVRRAVWQARHEQDPNIPPPAELVIAPNDYAAMVKKLFDEAFPPGTKFGTPLPAAPAVAAPPPPPPPGFFRRVVQVITFSDRRARRRAEEERARAAAEHQKAVEAAVAAGLPLDEMEGRLAEAVTVDENDLRALAQARAQRVRDYFTQEGRIAPERLFLAQAGARPEAGGKGPRVFLNLQ